MSRTPYSHIHMYEKNNVSSIISKQQGQCRTIIIAYCPLCLGTTCLTILFSMHVNVAEGPMHNSHLLTKCKHKVCVH